MWIADKLAGVAVGKVALWFGIVLGFVIGLMGLYIHHVRVQRDDARADVVTLTQQLATEHAVSEGLAQVAKDTANAASARASETLVQKNREITAQNSQLKKDINHAYENKNDAGNCFSSGFGGLWNAANALRDSETAAP